MHIRTQSASRVSTDVCVTAFGSGPVRVRSARTENNTYAGCRVETTVDILEVVRVEHHPIIRGPITPTRHVWGWIIVVRVLRAIRVYPSQRPDTFLTLAFGLYPRPFRFIGTFAGRARLEHSHRVRKLATLVLESIAVHASGFCCLAVHAAARTR